MIKRIADLLEKVAAGSFMIGMYQEKNVAMAVALWLFTASLLLTWFDAHTKGA
jgi:hypothetical protein